MSLVFYGRLLYGEKAAGTLRVIARTISVYGELEEGVQPGTVLLVKGTRGSTVAPYVLYRLARRGRAPTGILVWGRAEPMLVAGAVIARITLVDELGMLNSIRLEDLSSWEGCNVNIVRAGEKRARVDIRCL